MIVMPQLARLISEFENLLPETKSDEEDDVFLHHEDSKSFQINFQKDVVNFYNTVLSFGNPFEIEHPNLLRLMTQEIVDDAVVESIHNLQS